MEINDSNKPPKSDDIIGHIINFLLGVLISIVGFLIFITGMTGTRWITAIEGIWPRFGGVVFIFLGVYLIISSIRKIVIHCQKKRGHGK